MHVREEQLGLGLCDLDPLQDHRTERDSLGFRKDYGLEHMVLFKLRVQELDPGRGRNYECQQEVNQQDMR